MRHCRHSHTSRDRSNCDPRSRYCQLFLPTRLSENTFSTSVGNGHSTRALCVLASADAHYRRYIPRSFSPVHWLIVIVVLVVLFGAQRPPDASRSLSRSLMVYRPEHPDNIRR